MLAKFATIALFGAVAIAQDENPLKEEWDLELSDEGFGGSRFGGFRGGPSGGSYFDRRPTGRSGPRGRGGPTGPRRRAGPTGPRGRGGYQPEDEPAEDGEAGEVDPKASWYSQWSQYSAPAVRYIPEVRKPTFTNCDLQAVGEGIEGGTIQFAQFPGQPMKAKYDIEGMDVGTTYKVFAHKFGVLGESCEYIGPDYNPLFEVDSWGRPNPYQDPSRGRFPDLTSSDAGEVDGELVDDIMQNLAGRQSLIGRSIVISIEGEPAPRACCTVGRAPNPAAKPKPEPQPAYNPYQGHYYGGYQPRSYPQYESYQAGPQYSGYQGGYQSSGPRYGGYQGGSRGSRGQQGRGYYRPY